MGDGLQVVRRTRDEPPSPPVNGGPPRERALRDLAQRIGFSFQAGDPLGVSGIGMPWVPGGRPTCTNELSGRWRGLPVSTADVRWGSHLKACTVAVVELRADLPQTLIGRGGMERAGPPVDLGGDGIGRGVDVGSADPTFARRVLSPQLRAWLRSLDGRFDFLLTGPFIVVAARFRRRGRLRLLRPTELPYLLEAARGFCLRIPPPVWIDRAAPSTGGEDAPFGWGLGSVFRTDQVVPRQSAAQRLQLLDRASGALSLAGVGLILLSFLQVWIAVVSPFAARSNGIWWADPGGIWALLLFVVPLGLSGLYSMLGGRALRITRAVVSAILTGFWLSWCVSSFGDIRTWARGLAVPGLPLDYRIGPGPRTGIVGSALALAGAALLVVAAIAFRRESRIAVGALEAPGPDGEVSVDRALAYVPAVAAAPTNYRAPMRTRPLQEPKDRELPTSPPDSMIRTGAAVCLVVSLGVLAFFGVSKYRRAEEFARYGVPVVAQLVHIRCYQDSGGGDGGDPCDVVLSYPVDGLVDLATLTHLDDQVAGPARACSCMRILYDRRHPQNVSTTSILSPADVLGILTVIAIALILVFGRPIIRRKPAPPARPDRPQPPRRATAQVTGGRFGRNSRTGPDGNRGA